MALGSTQPLTEVSNRNISWRGKCGRCVGLTTLRTSCADCLEIRQPQPHEPSEPVDGLLYLSLRHLQICPRQFPYSSVILYKSRGPPRNTNVAKPHSISPSRFRTISPSTLFTHTLNHSSSNVVIHGHQTMPHAALHFCSSLQSIVTTCMALHGLSLCTEMSK
jgi:hypothetical protein